MGGLTTYLNVTCSPQTCIADDGALMKWVVPSDNGVEASSPTYSLSPEGPTDRAPVVLLSAHTFEFRLSGSEEQEQSLELPPIPRGDGFVVGASQVRSFVTRDPGAADAAIGSIEVRTEVRAQRLVCSARLSDFGPADLVVVQVEGPVYRCRRDAGISGPNSNEE